MFAALSRSGFWPGASIIVFPGRKATYPLLANYGCHSMFKEPGESSPKRITEKVDRAAASSRSPIRREPTVRDFAPRRQSAERSESRVRGGPTSDLLPRTRTRTVHVRQDDGPARVLDEPSSQEGRRWSTMVDSVRYGDEEAVENSRRRQAGEELLRDALQYRRPGQRMRVPRSPRTSALRFEVAPASRSSASPERSVGEQALLARPYMPSPPYSFSDNSTTGSRLRGLGGLTEYVPEPTPGFAPAQGVHRDNEERELATRGSIPRHYTPPGESSWTASYPPLHRVAHISPRPESNLSRYGGLGDRRPSVSSSSSDAEQDTWDTLLTTMEPDTHLPSTDSSFTSATATQSNRQSRHSSQTQNTSFASTTTPTERHLSRPTSPTIPHLGSRTGLTHMDIEIRSLEYDSWSEESLTSMSSILDIIMNLRRFRAIHPTALAAERRRRTDENQIILNHFNTLRTMDGLRAPPDARASIMQHRPGRQHHNPPRRSQPTTEDSQQQHVALDLLRTIGVQTHRMVQDIEDARMENSRQDTPSTPGRGFEQAAEDLRRNGAWGQWSQHDEHGQEHRDTTDMENDLEYMQRFIERMARREDIPDEWWAGAGLARTIRETQ